MELEDILHELSTLRPLFHTRDDFKRSLACEILLHDNLHYQLDVPTTVPNYKIDMLS